VPNETAEKPATTEEEGVWTRGPDGELVPDYNSAFPEINEGEVVHGTVVRVDKDEVLVDIGYKSEGVIPVAELTIRRAVNPADEVAVGEEIDALVLTKEDTEGRLILSKKRARFELAWKKIEAAAESGEPVTGKVIEVVKGGLILDLGVRGFLPASLVDIRRVQDLDEFLGRELRCKVIELNRSRNNVVLSRRAVLEDERKEMRQAILDRLSPGDVIEGQISNIVDFGAFVDLDGMDGLIHISELSWSHVNHPSEVLEIGQTVKVKVLDIDRERQRISLGLKQTQSDPWQQVLDSYREGDVVEGRVAKVVTFGAFVEILPGVEGLVHISELAPHHVENPREVVSQGQAVNVRILEIDGERRRLSLSLKRVEEGEQPVPRADGGESVHTTPELVLTEEAFPASSATETPIEAADENSIEAPAEDAAEDAAEIPAETPAETAAEVVEEVEAGEEVEEEAEADEPRAEAETAPADETAAEASPDVSAAEGATDEQGAEAADEPDAAA
jgi:small subunit ribosomal protein S1